MVNLNWCKQQKVGIRLIEPNDRLSKNYLGSAWETLKIMELINEKSDMWLATMKYYLNLNYYKI